MMYTYVDFNSDIYLDYIFSDRIKKSLKNNVFWMPRLDLVDDSTQLVWNVHVSLEWWIEHWNCSRKLCQENNV